MSCTPSAGAKWRREESRVPFLLKRTGTECQTTDGGGCTPGRGVSTRRAERRASPALLGRAVLETGGGQHPIRVIAGGLRRDPQLLGAALELADDWSAGR